MMNNDRSVPWEDYQEPKYVLASIIIELGAEPNLDEFLEKANGDYVIHSSKSILQYFSAVVLVLLGSIIVYVPFEDIKRAIINNALMNYDNYAHVIITIIYLVLIIAPSVIIITSYRITLIDKNNRLTINTRIYCRKRTFKIDANSINYVYLSCRRIRGISMNILFWNIKIARKDGKIIPLTMTFLSNGSESGDSYINSMGNLPRRAWILSRLINRDIHFTCKGRKYIINSTRDICKLVGDQKEIKKKIMDRYHIDWKQTIKSRKVCNSKKAMDFPDCKVRRPTTGAEPWPWELWGHHTNRNYGDTILIRKP